VGKKKKEGFRWGFNWAQVGSGGLLFLGGGGVALVALLGGVIWFWPIAIAIIGFFIMLTGLMGEDGVW
jgi:hypothetical protein